MNCVLACSVWLPTH